MLKITAACKVYFGICFFVLLYQKQTQAQIVISTPNLGFSQACANESFNNFSTTFTFSPEANLEATNQFSIELSDAAGDFTNPTIVLTTSQGAVTTSPATLSFSLPTTTGGENYRIRIKSSAPQATSSNSAVFAAYYKLQDTPFTINNLVSTGAFCSGGSYLLAIDNPGTGSNDSPLNYPSLTFNWYKETGPTTAEFIVQGPTLSVTSEGTYFVETNYGTCTSDSFSNRVTISEVTSGESQAGISSSLGNPFCPSEGLTTLSTIGGNSYQWFKDEVPIPDATNQMFQTNEPGLYAVQVDLGDCSASGSIALESELFDAEINVSEYNTIEENETLPVVVTTSAISPNFEWYLNEELISGATENNYEVSVTGNYKIMVTETGASSCNGTKELLFTVNETFPEVENIPNVISPNGDGINDSWIIPTQYVSGSNTLVMIFNKYGKVLLETNNYLNDWPGTDLNYNGINEVFYYVIQTEENQTRKGSITVIK